MCPGKNVYFLSDIHLGAAYIPDGRAHERKIVDFLKSIEDDCCELYLLGDVLDFWFEYKNVAPQGFVRFLGTLAGMADRGIRIVWLTGNHDIWLFGYLRNEIGMEVVDGACITEISGKRFYLEHGDGVGKLSLSFRFIRSVFRNRVAQKIGSALHPRWLVGLAHLWSSHSRKSGGYTLAEDVALASYMEFAREYNRNHPDMQADYFLFGHQHVMVSDTIRENNAVVAILGDCMRLFTYAKFDGKKLSFLSFK